MLIAWSKLRPLFLLPILGHVFCDSTAVDSDEGTLEQGQLQFAHVVRICITRQKRNASQGYRGFCLLLNCLKFLKLRKQLFFFVCVPFSQTILNWLCTQTDLPAWRSNTHWSVPKRPMEEQEVLARRVWPIDKCECNSRVSQFNWCFWDDFRRLKFVVVVVHRLANKSTMRSASISQNAISRYWSMGRFHRTRSTSSLPMLIARSWVPNRIWPDFFHQTPNIVGTPTSRGSPFPYTPCPKHSTIYWPPKSRAPATSMPSKSTPNRRPTEPFCKSTKRSSNTLNSIRAKLFAPYRMPRTFTTRFGSRISRIRGKVPHHIDICS